MELDDEARSDLMEAFIDLQGESESYVVQLLEAWDLKIMHSLFRAIHNIKGNAGLMGVEIIVHFTHELEEVAGALRQGRFSFSEPVAETILLALDRLHDLHQQELYGKRFDHLRIDELQMLYHALSCASESEALGIAQQVLTLLGVGDVEEDIDLFLSALPTEPQAVEWSQADPAQEEKLRGDLSFFRELALQIDNQVPGWEGRSIQMFDWAMKMNQLAKSPVNELQFGAAIYMHDLGMTLIPDSLWDKKRELNSNACADLSRHPSWAYEYLRRVPGWEEAATIVLHHHEYIDGSGYPSGLKGDQIHTGAKILAILDTFFFLTNGRVDSSLRRTSMRAISAINARIDTQFEGMWVQCFNHLVRKELKAGHI